MSEDPTMERISAAITILQSGDRELALRCFSEIWSDLAQATDAFHICVLAHYMADAQDDVHKELEWDLRALAAAQAVTDERAKQYHAELSIKSFFPSLHLNVGDAYFRIGDMERARHHVRAAKANLRDLPDSPLTDMIRGGVARLSLRLDERSCDWRKQLRISEHDVR